MARLVRTLLQAVQLSRDAVVENGCSLHSWRIWCTFGSHICQCTYTTSEPHKRELPCCAAILQQYLQPLLSQYLAPNEGNVRCVVCNASHCMRLRRNAPDCLPAAPFLAKRVAPAGGLRCAWFGRAALSACGSRTCVLTANVLCKVCSPQAVRHIEPQCVQATAARVCRNAPGRCPSRCSGHPFPRPPRSRPLAAPAPAAHQWPPAFSKQGCDAEGWSWDGQCAVHGVRTHRRLVARLAAVRCAACVTLMRAARRPCRWHWHWWHDHGRRRACIGGLCEPGPHTAAPVRRSRSSSTPARRHSCAHPSGEHALPANLVSYVNFKCRSSLLACRHCLALMLAHIENGDRIPAKCRVVQVLLASVYKEVKKKRSSSVNIRHWATVHSAEVV